MESYKKRILHSIGSVNIHLLNTTDISLYPGSENQTKAPTFFTSLKCNKRGNSNNIYMEKRNSTLPQLHNQVKRNLTKTRPIPLKNNMLAFYLTATTYPRVKSGQAMPCMRHEHFVRPFPFCREGF